MKFKELSEGEFNGVCVAEFNHTHFHLAEQHYEPGMVFEPHRHERPFLSLLMEGDYWEGYHKNELDCTPDQVVFHPPGDIHEIAFGRETVKSINLEFSIPYFFQLGLDDRTPRERTMFEAPGLCRLMKELQAEVLDRDAFSTLVIESLFLELIAGLGKKGTWDNPKSWLPQILEHIQGNFRDPIRLVDLAKSAGLHPAYLSAAFRKLVGRTLGEYVRDVRVGKAVEKLKTGQKSLAEIAYETGFADQSHMTRAFRKVTGETPGKLRRKYFH